MKKICMIVPSFTAKGGIASVVSGYRNSELEKQYNIRYIETYTDKNKVCKVLKAISAYLKFLLCLIFWKPDLVHIHSSFNGSFYRKLPFIYLSSWWHKPIVNHVHGAEFEQFYLKASGKKQNKVKSAYLRCQKIVALSEEWKGNLSHIVSEDKIEVIENYSIIQDKERREPGQTILFLGFLCERKGCYDIPNVVKKVVAKYPDVRFVLAGSGSEADERKMKELVRNNNIESNVLFPGWVRGNQKNDLLSDADIFFLPSYNEGKPMAILDAMGYGLPIISTDVGGISNIVHNGENGYILIPGDIQGFADAIVKLLEDKELMIKMGKESLKIIEQGYSLDAHIQKISDLYEHLLDISNINA